MGYSKENGVVSELVSLVGLATLSRRFYVGLAQVRDFCPAPIRILALAHYFSSLNWDAFVVHLVHGSRSAS